MPDWKDEPEARIKLDEWHAAYEQLERNEVWREIVRHFEFCLREAMDRNTQPVEANESLRNQGQAMVLRKIVRIAKDTFDWRKERLEIEIEQHGRNAATDAKRDSGTKPAEPDGDQWTDPWTLHGDPIPRDGIDDGGSEGADV